MTEAALRAASDLVEPGGELSNLFVTNLLNINDFVKSHNFMSV
jgi:hypothetical protein